MFRRLLLAAAGLACTAAAPLAAQELNLYSSRHYDTDRSLYDGFTAQTGIRVRLVEGDADQLIERIRSEGAASPADVLITVDAARLIRAQDAGVLQPVRSALLEERIPAYLRDPQGHWFGLSKRARVIVYGRTLGLPAGLSRYEDLSGPAGKGLCIRSSNHPYNTSLMGSVLAANGVEVARSWAAGVVGNFARPPQGGDTPQLMAVAAGQCRLAVSNTYYLARLKGQPTNAAERAAGEKLAVLFPNQADRGTHVNISGAGVVRTAPNRDGAVRFLEYLASTRAQEIFALGNFEYPVVAEVPLHPALSAMGSFKEDQLNAASFGSNATDSLQLMQQAGWR